MLHLWSPEQKEIAIMELNPVVPELYCSDIERSLAFYTTNLGFKALFVREEDRFAFLDRDGAQIMIEQPLNPARTWLAGELQPPYGRGVNLLIRTTNVAGLYARLVAAECRIQVPIEEKWYRRDEHFIGARQFVVQDPDGYLLRFSEGLGARAKQ
jgi:catechol 2,3-dioxygenase-like lactoylglutathione lyase family enzyme